MAENIYIGGNSKIRFAQNFQFLTPPFDLRFSELHPLLRKNSTKFMNVRMRNRGVKREKIIFL